MISHEHARERERESIDSNIFPRCFPIFPSDFMTPLPLLQGADGSSKATPLQKRGWITWSLFQVFGVFGYISPHPQPSTSTFHVVGTENNGPAVRQANSICLQWFAFGLTGRKALGTNMYKQINQVNNSNISFVVITFASSESL